MLHAHLAVALRGLRRDARYAALNVVGLGLALAVAFVVLAWVQGERAVDAWHARAGSTYRVLTTLHRDGDPDATTYASSPSAVAALARESVPGVVAVAQIVRGLALEADGAAGERPAVDGVYDDAALFDVFSLHLASGDAATALSAPGRLVVSEATARRLFGDAAPVGQTVAGRDGQVFTVSGVLAEPGGRTHLPLGAVASLASLAPASAAPASAAWDGEPESSYAYLVLGPSADPAAVGARLDALARARFPETDRTRLDRLELQPLSQVNLSRRMLDDPLGASLPAAVAYLLAALALVLLGVACVNYAGLAVARGLARSRDVGIRKALGADRRTLVAQSLVEALVVAALAAGVGVALAAALVPVFNGLSFVVLSGSALTARALLDPVLIGAGVALVVFVAVAAGLYPALVLTRVRPAAALQRGRAGTGGSQYVRKGLVVTQFVAAVVLVTTAMTGARQSAFLLATDYGVETARTLVVSAGDVPAERLVAWAQGRADVEAATATSKPPGYEGRPNVWLRASAEAIPVEATDVAVDAGFLKAMELRLVAGEEPSGEGVVLNATAARALGFSGAAEALGASVRLDSLARDVVGVVADYQAGTAALGVTPVVLTADTRRLAFVLVRTRPGAEARVRADLVAASTALGAQRPLRPEGYAEALASTGDKTLLRETAGVVGLVAALALVVAALGLLALAAFAVQRRTREVGIRKVLGAGMADVARVVSGEFVGLVAVSLVVAVPRAVVLTEAWLDLFGRRAALGPGALALAVLPVVACAALAVGTQVLRAERLDPVRSLRSE